MKNFLYSNNNKRYHTLNYHYTSTIGKAQKASLDAGFTCPNIDGTKGIGGCLYCDGGSGYFTSLSYVPIEIQLENEIKRIHIKHPDAKIIAYFQAHSNTYADAGLLRCMYEKVLSNKNVCGIAIATRADCLEDETIRLLNELSKRTYLTVELGLQTIYDETATAINRCHSYNEFLEGYTKLRQNGIRVCVHIINGLPGETQNMMYDTARQVGLLYPDGIKIHLLHVIKGTPLEKMYQDGKFETMNKDEYVETVVKQLELLPPTTVIERITGDGDKKKLIAPLWSRDKISVLGTIDKLQAERDSWQGKFFEG